MIYHTYSPYYYGSSPIPNNKILNSNNFNNIASYSSNTNTNNLYTTSLNNVNKKYYTTQYKKKPYYNFQSINSPQTFSHTYHTSDFTPPQESKKDTNENSNQKKIPPKANNDTIFEIFGIKLYFDDILLICLIFFLYNEGVQDQYLFIALILLLLS